MIVADTNLVAYLLIEGEWTERARRVRALDPAWVLPPLWRSEFLNVLATSVGAGVLSESLAYRSWRFARSLFRGSEHEPEAEAVLQIAISTGISAYDAQFVAVASALEAPLVTADRALLEACPDRTVDPESFLASAGGRSDP